MIWLKNFWLKCGSERFVQSVITYGVSLTTMYELLIADELDGYLAVMLLCNCFLIMAEVEETIERVDED